MFFLIAQNFDHLPKYSVTQKREKGEKGKERKERKEEEQRVIEFSPFSYSFPVHLHLFSIFHSLFLFRFSLLLHDLSPERGANDNSLGSTITASGFITEGSTCL